jgi:hypothetical protein
MKGAVQSMDGGGGGGDGRRQALQWGHDCGGQWQQQWRHNGRQDGGAITMHGIEIAVDGGGGDG